MYNLIRPHENLFLNQHININLELKRYYLHSDLPKEKKMDLYIYQLDKNTKVAYLSVAKCASNEIRDIFKTLTGNQKRLEINIKDKNDPRLKDLIIFSCNKGNISLWISLFRGEAINQRI